MEKPTVILNMFQFLLYWDKLKAMPQAISVFISKAISGPNILLL